MPSYHGKSRLVSAAFVAWALGQDPTLKIGLISYSAKISQRFSKLARWRVMNPLYQKLFPETRLQMGDVTNEHWATTKGGFVRAVGIGGSLTGIPLDILILDDPYSSWQEAHSPTTRETVWDWFGSVGLTRLSEDGVCIIIHTRWHPDDLIGRLKDPVRQKELSEDMRWTHVNLEALAPANDPLGREIGEPLAPRLHSKVSLENKRAALGSYLWLAIYCGRPKPKGGNYIDVSNIILVDTVPESLHWVRFWDLAASEEERNDFTAGVCAALDKQGKIWLRDIVNVQLEWPKARQLILGIAKAEEAYCGTVGIEAVGGFKTSVQNIREAWPPTIRLIEVGVDQDKIVRAIPWMTMAENRAILLLRGKNTQDFLDQVSEFPKGAYMDMIDAVSGSVALLRTLPQVPQHAPGAPMRDYRSVIQSRRNRTLIG